jgi:putative phosphoribosyl transferase
VNTGRAPAPAHTFRDRSEAGRLLAQQLRAYAGRPDAVVLALPRGGVPVGYEIARELHLPLDIFAVKKITVPGFDESALGAVSNDGMYLIDDALIEQLGLSKRQIEAIAANAYREVQRRESAYRNHRAAMDVTGKTVILVDDGLATGSSMQAAVAALRRKRPAKIVVAVPVASREACADLQAIADEIVCARMPDPFYAVGLWYDDFAQTEDGEVRNLLAKANAPESG